MTVARRFVEDYVEYKLDGDNYSELVDLSIRILRKPPFSERLSREFVEVEVFKWCHRTIMGRSTETLSSCLKRLWQESVREQTLWIPLSGLEIEESFGFGNFVLRTIEPSFFDDAQRRFVDKHGHDDGDAKAFYGNLRQKFSGTAAVEVSLLAEAGYAQDAASRIASEVIAVFRFLSPAASSPVLTYPGDLAGSEHIPSRTVFKIRDGHLSTVSSGLTNFALFNWRLSTAEMKSLMNTSLRLVTMFFEDKKLNDFQLSVKSSLLAYSRSVARYEKSERLTGVLSSLEGLLLADSSEPVQSGVGERMAFLIAGRTEDRKKVVSNLKKVYAYRSRYVHHLKEFEIQEDVREFFRNAWSAIFGAIANLNNFEKKSEFLEKLDHLKLS